MQNPLSFLFQEPSSEQPLDARVAKTCTEWDVAQMVMDDVHAALQEMPLNNAEDPAALSPDARRLCRLCDVRGPDEAATGSAHARRRHR